MKKWPLSGNNSALEWEIGRWEGDYFPCNQMSKIFLTEIAFSHLNCFSEGVVEKGNS